ncbi:transglutaminase domain-containing protein [Paenibacillus sp. FSL R5-0407]|uniref:transglutaminase family protein n=1 Tax=Paenibacillus sp. FSL R5-0407 TaxID=2975320 RepID=UPI0030F93360
MKRSHNRTLFSWYRLFSVLWLLVIAMQWIDYTEPLWFDETTALVTVTLLSVAAIELLPLRATWRWIIKAIVVMAGWRIVLIAYDVFLPSGRLVPDQLYGMAQQFTPYIWFSLAAWVFFELALELLNGKKRILLFLAGDLIAFAILDSFTSYYLWQNVAWTVFAGLGWLASLHFRSFQLKYPHGWNRLRHQPLRIAANIVAIFACVLLIGVSMPSVSPVLTDPYTAWKNRGGPGGNAAATPVSSTDSGSVTIIAPQEVISGYSRDDKELGGGFEFSYGPVMTVDTSVRSYWRGETRRNYTGKGWMDLSEEGREFNRIQGVSTGELPGEEIPPKVEIMQVEQTITMQNEEIYPVLFGGYTMGSVELLDEEEQQTGGTMMWAPKEAELHWEMNHQALTRSSQPIGRLYPKKYKVVANIPVIPLEELREASFESLYPADKENAYLQIPSGFPDRVRELALQVTAEGTTPYRKMELLQDYLRQNYEYTNQPDLSLKKSEDFVDSFLFEIKQGYCDYYSTAMVMMARSLGIPARWVKGYSPGTQPNPEYMQRFPETGMDYRVNNADAHSWTELYFGDYGWVPFEATPGFSAPVLYKQDGSVMTLADSSDLDGASRDNGKGMLESMSPETIRNLIIICVAVILVWAVYQLRSVLYFAFFRLRLGRPLTLGEKAVLQTQHLIRRLRRRGFNRSGDETLRESVDRWKEKQPELAATLDTLLSEFERASYSPESFSPQQWRIVREQSRKLMRMTRKRKKRERYAVMR